MQLVSHKHYTYVLTGQSKIYYHSLTERAALAMIRYRGIEGRFQSVTYKEFTKNVRIIRQNRNADTDYQSLVYRPPNTAGHQRLRRQYSGLYSRYSHI